jgi:ubiquinol-cytochrome c reductase cytochrome c subunit
MKTKLLLLLLVTAVLEARQQPQAAGAKNGEALFFKYGCYECHGYSGQNGPGARLVPMRMTLAQFTSYVRNPSRMPPYTSKVLPDAQLADIYAYIGTLRVAPAAKDIPLLNQLLKEK